MNIHALSQTTHNVYRTKDFYEASALLASKVKLIRLEKEKNHFWFVFHDQILSVTISDAYWSNTLKVLAKDYAEAIRSLKDRLFARG